MAAKKKSSRKKTAAKKVVSKKKASPRKKSAAKKVAKKAAKKAVREKALRPRDEKEEEKGKVPELEVVVESAVEAAGGARVEQERQPEPIKEEPEPTYEVPEKLDVNEFRERSLASLLDSAAEFPLKVNSAAGKSALIFELLAFYSKHGTELEAEGVLEQAKENYAMLRDPVRSFRTSPDDFYVGGNILKQHGLRAGQKVRVKLRAPRERDKYLSALEVLTIEGSEVSDFDAPKGFDQLTSLFPEDRFVLERPSAMSVRLIDIVAPLGKGQRGLIVAPPRGGKTILLKEIAKSISINHPETKLIVLLLDERPEEVTDFEETVDAEVFSSTFDEPSKRHAQVSDLVLERARRLVELGQDVVILLDSLTRLARGYNNSQRGGGPVGSGGLSPQALQKSRKFFGAARNVEEGGSLTIVATCLIETESRMDDIIFEELKGTGNMEIRLDRELAESRIYPAIHIPQSGTRNDDRLYHPEEMNRVIEIRRALTTLPIGEALETLLRQLAKNSTNAELLMRGMI
jgi:transcription termination factor Rho